MKKLFLYGIACMFSITYQMGLAQISNINNIAMNDNSEYKINAYHVIEESPTTKHELRHFIRIEIEPYFYPPISLDELIFLVIKDDNYYVSQVCTSGKGFLFAIDAFSKFENEVTITLEVMMKPKSGIPSPPSLLLPSLLKIENIKINDIIQMFEAKEYYNQVPIADQKWLKSLGYEGIGFGNGIVQKNLSKKKSEQPINNIMQDEEKDDIEVKIIKDTATWVDGKTYQFIELVINEDHFIEIDLERIYIADLNEIKIIIGSKSMEIVFIPIKVNDKYLFLIDDFDDYNKVILSVWCVIHYAVWDRNNLSQDFLSTTVEVNFEEIRNTKFPDIYPEADSAWYKKWKEENPDFKGERERYEKRK